MLKSMTGFSRCSQDSFAGMVSLEISSVNHRYQEISTRVPREFTRFEPLLQQKMRSAFKRGKVVVRLEICWAPSLQAGTINREILESYMQKVADARKAAGLQPEVDVESLLQLPGVVSTGEGAGGALDEDVSALLRDLLARGIQEWNAMRQKEGDHLEKAIREYLDILNTHCEKIKGSWENARDSAIESLKERIANVMERYEVSCDASRLAQEITLLSDKWDITEELVRLDSHMVKFRSMLDNGDVSGKTLDFLVQEMNREVNTTGSKTADADIRWLAVEAKTVLENIREQIQNVE
ncbi:MAG: YicC/YloC family endoribonuclease [Synergistota bacterium]|nr:YicC/YloC family endoribonuclease [Synergistota bacterium]